MGKKQHQKDKLYLTTTEWRETYGGCKEDIVTKALQAKFKRLPLTHCALSLQPFEDPMCSLDGHIYDILQIIPYIKKFGTDPVTGTKLDAKSLVRLHFHKNNEGEYFCPVTYKVFTNSTHVVAIRTSGNVYSYEAIDELNLKPKNFKDLMNDEPFTRKDIITLQDPHNLDKFNISNFYHVKNKKKVINEEELKEAMMDPKFYLRSVNQETKETLAALKRDYVQPAKQQKQNGPKADAVNAAHYSTGMVAAGLTSTVMEPLTVHESAALDDETLLFRRVTKKGYVRVITNLGLLNLELHCDLTPKTCQNFIKHCLSGYYKGTIFHRLIKHFMVQGGDPTGTGKGGESAFGQPFKDEFVPQLSHNARGILSMANSGTDTNKSQFFITFRQETHLDRKHTIFGRVVGGLDTLKIIEAIKTDKNDKPLDKIEILDTQVFVDPYEEAQNSLDSEREKLKTEAQAAASSSKSIASAAVAKPKEYRQGVGKYIAPIKNTSKPVEQRVNPNDVVSAVIRGTEVDEEEEQRRKKKKLKAGTFGDFGSW